MMGNMIQLEHDYLGRDYSLNLKALNPSPVDGSGIVIGSYLQSLTPRLALGAELLYQRGATPPGAPSMGPAVTPSFVARYTSGPDAGTPNNKGGFVDVKKKVEQH